MEMPASTIEFMILGNMLSGDRKTLKSARAVNAEATSKVCPDQIYAAKVANATAMGVKVHNIPEIAL